jgi:Ran GTPase-activating protein (RanGAP) involved in mRNA processing and transport
VRDCDLAEGFAELALGVKCSSLRTLLAGFNRIKDRPLLDLAQSLKYNKTLEILDLSNNEIGELGGSYIARAISWNKSLK